MAICAVSIWISSRYIETHWVVGPVFGISYLAANADKLKKNLWLKYLLFLTASTLTYAVVYWITRSESLFKNKILDDWFDEYSTGVLFGTLTLPFLQGILFSIPFSIVWRSWLWLFGSWYVTLSFIGNVSLPDGITVNGFHIALAFWQGLYFYLLRGQVDRELAPAVPT